MPENKTVFVFARDDGQARHWKWEYNQPDVRTLHALYQLHGFDSVTVVLYGTYWLRPDYPQLQDYAQALHARLLSEEAFAEEETRKLATLALTGIRVAYGKALRPGTIQLVNKKSSNPYIVADSQETMRAAIHAANKKPTVAKLEEKPLHKIHRWE